MPAIDQIYYFEILKDLRLETAIDQRIRPNIHDGSLKELETAIDQRIRQKNLEGMKKNYTSEQNHSEYITLRS